VFHVKHSSATKDVPRETLERLQNFAALLLRWNRTVNLIARRDEPLLWDRHIGDCLQLAPLMQPRPERAIDLGSGAGFPGLVLAIATDVPFELIEVDQRKAAFLREAMRVTGAPVRVHASRIEEARLAAAPLITARALAPLTKLLGLAAPLLAPGGVCLFMKGLRAKGELTEAATEWHMQVNCIPSQTAPEAWIFRISDLARVARPD
jgi:16S rRNA (guanine527-N7)-methyltransferase